MVSGLGQDWLGRGEAVRLLGELLEGERADELLCELPEGGSLGIRTGGRGLDRGKGDGAA